MNSRNRLGVAALEMAIRREHGKIVRLLMEAGQKDDGPGDNAESFSAVYQVKRKASLQPYEGEDG